MNLEFLSREQLADLVQRQRETIKRLFIDPKDAETVEENLPEETFAQTDIDASNMLHEYRKRQLNFDTAPFDPSGEKFRLFPGGITIWSGYPGSGKTTLLRQLMCHLMHRGRGVFVASLEEDPNDALPRLMMTAWGTENLTDDQAEWFLHQHGNRLRLWGVVGLARYRAVLSAIRCAAKYGVRHAVIDSLTCLDIGGSDWDGQRGLANELATLARQTGVHIHLVAHPRKPQRHDAHPDIADIAGSSDLGRLCDNVIFIRRDSDTEPTSPDDATEMQVVVKKQRHGTGMCGKFHGWFHRRHKQFSLEQFWRGPIRYLPDLAYQEIAR